MKKHEEKCTLCGYCKRKSYYGAKNYWYCTRYEFNVVKRTKMEKPNFPGCWISKEEYRIESKGW